MWEKSGARGRSIKLGREALQLSGIALAQTRGVAEPTVSDCDVGKLAPSDRHELAITTEFHQDLRQLFALVRVEDGVA